MVRVLEVDNHPTAGRFERLRRFLAENGGKVTSTDWAGTGVSWFNEFDGVALSSAPDMTSEELSRARVGNRVIRNFIRLGR